MDGGVSILTCLFQHGCFSDEGSGFIQPWFSHGRWRHCGLAYLGQSYKNAAKGLQGLHWECLDSGLCMCLYKQVAYVRVHARVAPRDSARQWSQPKTGNGLD